MDLYSVVVFYPDGTKWEATYTCQLIAESVLFDKRIECYSIRGYVYDEQNKCRIMTYGMPLDE